MKMWSGRFGQSQNPDFEQWQRSFPFDRVLLPYEVAASQAHAVAIAKAGVLTSDELGRTVLALEQIAREEIPRPTIPPLKTYTTTSSRAWLNWPGKSATSCTRDAAATSRLPPTCDSMCASRSTTVSNLLVEFVGEFVKQAYAAGENAMPAYTHLQRAEPVLVAHWLLAYVEMFTRDLGRLADCRQRLNECPLGSGAVAGTILPLDREAMARQLDFEAPTANSMDATSDRDFAHGIRAGAVVRGPAPEPLGGGVHPLLDHRIWLRETAGGIFHGQQRHAAEEEPRRAGTDSRQSGNHLGQCDRAGHEREGAAARLQQGPAGNAAARFRGGRTDV